MNRFKECEDHKFENFPNHGEIYKFERKLNKHSIERKNSKDFIKI